jgi:hypothetical protein
MSNAVFPAAVRGLARTSTKTPEFSTVVQKAPSGSETRILQRNNPLWTFLLSYEWMKDDPTDIPAGLTYTDLQTLMGFYLARQGQFDDFVYDDPTDNSVGPAMVGSSPNLQAQLQVVTDGAGNYYSPIQRNLGGQFYEDITDLNGGIQVYANGVAKTQAAGNVCSGGGDYELHGPGLSIPGFSFGGLYLKWCAGAPTTPVTAQFNFYFRVRFDMDKLDFDKWLYQLWTIGGAEATNSQYLTLVTSRPAAA